MSRMKDYLERQKEADSLRPTFPPAGEKESNFCARVNDDGNVEIWNKDEMITLEDQKETRRFAWWLSSIFGG